jgi:hypothetical protein
MPASAPVSALMSTGYNPLKRKGIARSERSMIPLFHFLAADLNGGICHLFVEVIPWRGDHFVIYALSKWLPQNINYMNEI